jgi:hypothetical protein
VKCGLFTGARHCVSSTYTYTCAISINSDAVPGVMEREWRLAMSCRQGRPSPASRHSRRRRRRCTPSNPLSPPCNGSRRRRVFSVGRSGPTCARCCHSTADLVLQTCPRSQTPRPPPPRHPLPRRPNPRMRAYTSSRLRPKPPPTPTRRPRPLLPRARPPFVAPAGASMACSRPSSRP